MFDRLKPLFLSEDKYRWEVDKAIERNAGGFFNIHAVLKELPSFKRVLFVERKFKRVWLVCAPDFWDTPLHGEILIERSKLEGALRYAEKHYVQWLFDGEIHA